MPEPRVDKDGVPWCSRDCTLFRKADGVMLDKCAHPTEMFASLNGLCRPAVRAMARELRETEVRALAAEGRLRTLDRMAHDADDDVDDDDLRIATESGWEYRGKTLATIGDLADAWAAAHKEG